MKAKIFRFFSTIALAVALCTVASAQEFSATADEVAEWRVAAEKGEAWAQFNLGYAYFHGAGVAENKRASVRWYRKAAEQGLAEAQFKLSVAYDEGVGIPADKHESVRWASKAADQGHVLAQGLLGSAYAMGLGVDEDDLEAVRWWRKSADAGNAAAQFNLANAYSSGEGVVADKREAVRWYRKAAEQGLAVAQLRMGNAYFKGDGIFVDKRAAVHWWRKAAEQGSAEAQFYGSAHAQFNLGFAYFIGEGVITDKREAYIWYSIAKANGNESAAESLRDTIGWRYHLTQSEIRSAQKEAARRLEAIDRSVAEIKKNSAESEINLAPKPKSNNSAERVFENAWRSVVVVQNGDSQGSGIIVRPNVVATNCHVIDEGGKITVHKSDNRRADTDTAFTATIRHADYEKDLCLLDVKNLLGVPATVRKYDTLTVGENVYGLGAPKGWELSLSTGVISQLRELDGDRFIQTDTAISPGSSGGGLFDSDGNLIGILTGKITDDDVDGIGFAIPADLVLGN